MIVDGYVKSLKFNKNVIPAKAGIQNYQIVTKHLTPLPPPRGGRLFTGTSLLVVNEKQSTIFLRAH
jgi:hypothetical protein